MNWGCARFEDRLHVHDLHASILHLLGIDNMKLTYFHKAAPNDPRSTKVVSFSALSRSYSHSRSYSRQRVDDFGCFSLDSYVYIDIHSGRHRF